MEHKFKPITPSPSPWKTIKQSPPQVRELYIVVQVNESGERIRGAAYWEQNGNGEWAWNKENITHWMNWPELPV